MRISVDEITRIMRRYITSNAREAEARRTYRQALERIAARESEAGGLERLRQVHDRLVIASDPAGDEGFPTLWRGRLPDGPPRYGYQQARAMHVELMRRVMGGQEADPDDIDRVQPPIRDQWEQSERVSPTYAPDRATEANMTTDDILVAIDESLREYDDEARANEQAQADKIAARKDRRGETAAAGGASPSDILDRIAVPGGNWPTS